MAALLRNNQLIELFLEQRRSRSGKVQHVNESLFHTIVNLGLNNMKEEQKRDTLFVPVTINYDRVIDGELFPQELLGEDTPKESLFKFLKHFVTAKKEMGKVVVRFCKPISFQDYTYRYLQANNRTLEDLIATKDPKFAAKIGEELCYT